MFGREKTPADRENLPARDQRGRSGEKGEPGNSPPWNLYLKSADRRIPASVVARSPILLQLAAEDACWQAATENWAARRPAPWRTAAKLRWREEGEQLRRKAHRLAETATEILT